MGNIFTGQHFGDQGNREQLLNAMDRGLINERDYKLMSGYDTSQEIMGLGGPNWNPLKAPANFAASGIYNLGKKALHPEDYEGRIGAWDSTLLNTMGSMGYGFDKDQYSGILGLNPEAFNRSPTGPYGSNYSAQLAQRAGLAPAYDFDEPSGEMMQKPRAIDGFGNTVAPNIPMGEDTSDLSGRAEVREPTQINNTYQTYMHPYDEVDRWTADEDMQYQPDVKSNRLSFLTNPVKKGAGMLMSGLMKIPGAGTFLNAVKPASPELKAQAGAVSAADTSGLMAGQNMISGFGTNDPEQMILDRVNRIKNRKIAQTDFSRNRIKELQRLADEANRAKHTATADLGGGWTRQNRPGGEATFTGPGGQTHQGWSNTDAGFAAAAESEGSFARGGYMRSRYNKGGRVGILAAF
tara:strand:+ start:42 stop:1265 length:1224 start_codon:yes stop_codon:yes gene_type:complete